MTSPARDDAATPARSALLIAYHFPPSAAVGGARIATFARSLAAAGWQPTVLTIRERDIARIDRDRLRNLDGITVRRTRVLLTLDRSYAILKGRLARRRRPGRPAPPVTAAHGGGAQRRESVSQRLRRYVLSFLMLPDGERGWILPATWAAARLIRKHRIGWFVTSCPPFSVHVIGLAVKRLTRARWIAGFRDPWMTTGSKQLYPTSAASLRIERWLERKVIEHADIVLFSVARLRDAYRARYSHVDPEKFVYLPNVVTPPDRATALPRYDAFTLSYTGVLYLRRSPEPVLQAIAQLISRGEATAAEIRVKLVGDCRDIDGVPTASVVARYGLQDVVEILDPVPHSTAVEIIRRSHLALVFAPSLPYQIPAKVYDYLSTGTRILAVAEEGGTADMIAETQSGGAFASTDVEGMARFIGAELAAWRTGAAPPAAALDGFEFPRITSALVGHMTRVAPGVAR